MVTCALIVCGMRHGGRSLNACTPWGSRSILATQQRWIYWIMRQTSILPSPAANSEVIKAFRATRNTALAELFSQPQFNLCGEQLDRRGVGCGSAGESLQVANFRNRRRHGQR